MERVNSKKYRLITDNVFDIPSRLREVDRGYFVLLNRRSGNFEVHHTENIGSTYCLTIPYKELDSRTIDLVQQTRVENAEKLIAEMEARNEKREKSKENNMKDYVGEVAKDIWNYAHSDVKSTECRLNKKVVH